MKPDAKIATKTIASQASTPGKGTATGGMLRFLTCGSVDDGKSTVIGRLLYDSRLVVEDHLEALHRDSAKSGTTGDEPDLALLVDGLQAEREQGITIDVAYRYFATPKRKFIVADTPGHEQYTRNMATGASVSDCAIILVDAQKGLLTQTRRHSSIVHLLGIRHIVLAVNKMDLVDCSQERFEEICRAYMDFAGKLGIANVQVVPMAARDGDNVVRRSDRMTWYRGPTLLEHLETIDVGTAEDAAGFCLPVQWVNRPNAKFRGYTGTVSSGTIAPGKPVVVLPSGRKTKIREILTADGPLQSARKGRAITAVLEDEVDVSRGDVLADPANRPAVSDQVAADVIWMGDEPLLPGRRYIMKCGTQTLSGTVTTLKHKLDVDLLDEAAARDLTLNEIGLCNISFSRPIVIAAYLEERVLGSFLIIDRLTNATVGVGLIRFGLRRADNVHWQALDVDKATRAATIGQHPVCIWFTGLSGSGKSTIANLLEKKLLADGRHTYTLDGDNVRHGLNRDLGFTDADRVENIRRVAEVSKLMVDAGLIVLVSFISPFRAERQMAREMLEDGEFLEVFVDTPLDICEERDTKGLYRKARQGLIKNFTGIDSAYEEPEKPECCLDTAAASAEDLADYLFEQLRSRGFV